MEAAFLIAIFAALAWIKAFRYMMLALLLGIGAYQAALFGNIPVQSHLVIAFALATLVGTLLIQLVSHKAAKEDK